MPPDPARLIDALKLNRPILGIYDAPEADAFRPLVTPGPGACLFSAFPRWLAGETLHLRPEAAGCGGCGHWLFGLEGRPREAFLDFLVDGEGLKASRDLMDRWLDSIRPYTPRHGQLFVGPLRPSAQAYLRAVAFLVDPDQLSALIYGANYHADPADPPPVLAPMGAGCMQLLPLFPDLSAAQALLGGTDVAMRRHLPPDVLLFSVTVPLFERLCRLDGDSFLGKPFLRRLQAERGL